MSETFWLGRISAQIQDAGLVARHRYRLTGDTIEECLHVWRDSRAAGFARSVDEPQGEIFEIVSTQLRRMETCLNELTQTADQAEALAERANSACDPCIALARVCEEKVQTALHHAEEARQRGGRAMTSVRSVHAGLAELGSPPI